MQIHNALIGALLAMLGIAVIWHVSSYPQVAGQAYGPSLFPNAIGIGLTLLGVLLILRGIRESAGGPRFTTLPTAEQATYGAIAALYILSSVVTIVLFGEYIGMQLLVFVILLVGLTAGLRRPVIALVLAMGLTVLFDLIFRVFLRVPLPSGLLVEFF